VEVLTSDLARGKHFKRVVQLSMLTSKHRK